MILTEVLSVIGKRKAALAMAVKNALETARAKGELEFDGIPEFVIEVPREAAHGDFATNAAMLLARAAKKNPREIAKIISENFEADQCAKIQSIVIATAGIGGILASTVGSSLINSNWHSAYWMLGTGYLVVLILAIIFLKENKKAPVENATAIIHIA